MNEEVDLIGELSAGVSFVGEVSVAPAHGARAIRTRASLREKWPNEFLDGGKVAYFGEAEGEREKGGYPKGFHDWALERRNAWFAGFNAGWIYCRRRGQRAAGRCRCGVCADSHRLCSERSAGAASQTQHRDRAAVASNWSIGKGTGMEAARSWWLCAAHRKAQTPLPRRASGRSSSAGSMRWRLPAIVVLGPNKAGPP